MIACGRTGYSEKIYKTTIASVLALTVGSLTVSVSDCAPQAVAFASKNKKPKPPVIESETLALINKLSTQPELMNVQYLRWVIGSPENERSQLANTSKNYYWYSPLGHKCIYHLHQAGPALNVVTQSSFTFNVAKSQITTKEMEKLFGDDHKRVFDQQAYPVDTYQTAPYTYIACTQPHDTFRVEKIQICYDGPPLPPPNPAEILNAYNDQREKALAMGATGTAGNARGGYATSGRTANGRTQSQGGAYAFEAIPWLEREVRYRPQDAGLHLELARAYRSNLMLNEAIAEYGAAARLAGDDQNVTNACRNALIEMKVLPASAASPPPPPPRRPDKRSYLVQGAGNGPAGGL